jgi:hypothetical protein
VRDPDANFCPRNLSDQALGDVKAILKEAIDSAGFDSDLVNEAEGSTIQKTIMCAT